MSEVMAQKEILHYLERYGVLTTGIALYQLAHILPNIFQRAVDYLVEAGTVVKSLQEGRRPVYYLSQGRGRTLGELFP